jgi:hypothetical protein
MKSLAVVTLVVLSTVVFVAPDAPAASNAFYLAVKPGQCAAGSLAGKTLPLVPCSNRLHTLEVYAVGHGGWGHSLIPPYATALAQAGAVCKAAFVRKTGHAIRRPYGWHASWPDAGGEQTRYGDRVICGLTLFPHPGPLGAGTHIR